MTHELRFIDSFKFLGSSMSILVSNIMACSKCELYHSGDSLKRYVKEGKIKQYKGIDS